MKTKLWSRALAQFLLFFAITMIPADVRAGPVYVSVLSVAGGGIETTGSVGDAIVMTVTVFESGPGLTDYIIRLETGSGDITKFFLQTDTSLTGANFFDVTPSTFGVGLSYLEYAIEYGILFTDLSCSTCDFFFSTDGVPTCKSFSADIGSPYDAFYNTSFGAVVSEPFDGSSCPGFTFGVGAVPDTTTTPVQEPGTLLLLALGLVGIADASRQRNNNAR